MTTEKPPVAEAVIGHNNPPSDIEQLAADLQENHADLLKKVKDLSDAAGRIPATFEDAETAEKATTFIKTVKGWRNKLEDARVVAKKPFDAQADLVQKFFKGHDASLVKAIDKAVKALDVYTKAEHAKEQARLAQLARDEEDRKAALVSVAVSVASVDQSAGDEALEDALESELQGQKFVAASQKTSGLVAVRAESGATASLRTTYDVQNIDVATIDLEALRYSFTLAELTRAAKQYVRNGGTELKGAQIVANTQTVVR